MHKAITAGIALHTLLLGVLMFLWARRWQLHVSACLLSSVLIMFCTAHFLHVCGGHLSNLCTMAWTPLVFLAMDEIFRKTSRVRVPTPDELLEGSDKTVGFLPLNWILVGIFAVTMQILAGHPQYVYYTAIAVGLYWLVRATESRNWLRPGLALLLIYVGAASLSAIQLLPGLSEVGEGARASGLPHDFTARFSFQPGSLLTLLAPLFFGDDNHAPHWREGNFWEMTFFIGVAGLILAIYGCFHGRRSSRATMMIMIVGMIVLALGRFTPLFAVLMHFMPGFDKFRGTSKFIFFASMFLSLLAAMGYSQMWTGGIQRPHRIALFLVLAGVVGFIIGLTMKQLTFFGTQGWLGEILRPHYEELKTLRPNAADSLEHCMQELEKPGPEY